MYKFEIKKIICRQEGLVLVDKKNQHTGIKIGMIIAAIVICGVLFGTFIFPEIYRAINCGLFLIVFLGLLISKVYTKEDYDKSLKEVNKFIKEVEYYENKFTEIGFDIADPLFLDLIRFIERIMLANKFSFQNIGSVLDILNKYIDGISTMNNDVLNQVLNVLNSNDVKDLYKLLHIINNLNIPGMLNQDVLNKVVDMLPLDKMNIPNLDSLINLMNTLKTYNITDSNVLTQFIGILNSKDKIVEINELLKSIRNNINIMTNNQYLSISNDEIRQLLVRVNSRLLDQPANSLRLEKSLATLKKLPTDTFKIDSSAFNDLSNKISELLDAYNASQNQESGGGGTGTGVSTADLLAIKNLFGTMLINPTTTVPSSLLNDKKEIIKIQDRLIEINSHVGSKVGGGVGLPINITDIKNINDSVFITRDDIVSNNTLIYQQVFEIINALRGPFQFDKQSVMSIPHILALLSA